MDSQWSHSAPESWSSVRGHLYKSPRKCPAKDERNSPAGNESQRNGREPLTNDHQQNIRSPGAEGNANPYLGCPLPDPVRHFGVHSYPSKGNRKKRKQAEELDLKPSL